MPITKKFTIECSQKPAVILWVAFKQNTEVRVVIVKHGWCPTFTVEPHPSSSCFLSLLLQPILLVILRRTHRPIPARPLRAHSIKRVAFIPSIFTRDVSSSAAGFLAIRVTGSAISLFYPYPYTTLVVREIEGKNAPIRILYGYQVLFAVYIFSSR